MTFYNPMLLAFIVAAAIPILIHVFSKRQYVEVEWAAMQFLLKALKRKSRRFTLESLILLIVRTSILLLLGIALASPFFPKKVGTMQSSQSNQSLNVLVIDASYSMNFKNEGETAFEAAKKEALRIVSESENGDAFAILSMGNPGRRIIGQAAFDVELIKDEIKKMETNFESAQLESTISELAAILEQFVSDYPQVTKRRVFFISDFSENTWNKTNQPEIRELFSQLNERASLKSIQVGGIKRGNLAIVSVSQDPALVTVGQPVHYKIQIEKFGSVAAEATEVEISIDGNPVAKKIVDLKDNNSSTSFSHRFDAPGDHQIEFSIGADNLETDNRRFHVSVVSDRLRSLLLYGRLGDESYINAALSPSKSSNRRIETVVAAAATLSDQNLEQFDSIFFCNPAGFNELESKKIREFVSGGGAVLFALGNLTRIQGFKHLVNTDSNESQLLNATLIGESAFGEYKIDPLMYRHRILEVFRGVNGSGLLTIPVWKYIRIKSATKSTDNIALAFQNGDPAILTRRFGRGRAIFLTLPGAEYPRSTNADSQKPWGGFHLWPSFPPLIQESHNWAIQGKPLLQNLLVGDSLQGTLPSSFSRKSVKLFTPGGEPRAIRLTESAVGQTWYAGIGDEIGFYPVEVVDKISTLKKFSVNLNPVGESDVAQVSPENLPLRFDETEFNNNVAAKPSSPATLPFQHFLAVILLLLVVESSLAWLFARE